MKFKAYALLGFAALVVVAAIVLILNNLDRDWTMKVYYRDMTFRRGIVLLISALAGAAVYLIIRVCVPSGVRAWKSAAQGQRQKETEQRLKSLESQPPKQ